METTVNKTIAKLIEEEVLSPNKCYVVFNSTSFYIYDQNALRSLTGHSDINITLVHVKQKLGAKGTHFVAECDNMDIAMDFYNSGFWRSYN